MGGVNTITYDDVSPLMGTTKMWRDDMGGLNTYLRLLSVTYGGLTHGLC